jgi:hypothetical protein
MQAIACSRGSALTDLLGLRERNIAPPHQGSKNLHVHYERDYESCNDEDPVIVLKASLAKAHRKIRCLNQKRNFDKRQERRNRGTPSRHGSGHLGAQPTPPAEAKKEPKSHGTQDNCKRQLSEEGDSRGSRDGRQETSEVCCKEQTVGQLAFDRDQHLRRALTLEVSGPDAGDSLQ